MKDIVLTDYLSYRLKERNYDLNRIKEILRFGTERYFDTETGRNVVVGTHGKKTVLVPYEETEVAITPVTIHAITRQQIRFRINTGRFRQV